MGQLLGTDWPRAEHGNDTLTPSSQTVVVDDASAAKIRRLLLTVTLVSNFPLLIVGLGALLLVVLIILIYRARQMKVGGRVSLGVPSLHCTLAQTPDWINHSTESTTSNIARFDLTRPGAEF